MEEVFRTTDLVKLTYVQHLLGEAGIEVYVADQNMSTLEGMIGAFPQRIMVNSKDASRARHALREVEPG